MEFKFIGKEEIKKGDKVIYTIYSRLLRTYIRHDETGTVLENPDETGYLYVSWISDSQRIRIHKSAVRKI